MTTDRIESTDVASCGCGTPGSADPATCYCGVENLLRIIRRRYSLLVLNAIHTRGTARYHDIATALPRASSSTLAETLRALEAARLIERRDLSNDAAPHTSYTACASGVKLLRRLRGLLEDVRQ